VERQSTSISVVEKGELVSLFVCATWGGKKKKKKTKKQTTWVKRVGVNIRNPRGGGSRVLPMREKKKRKKATQSEQGNLSKDSKTGHGRNCFDDRGGVRPGFLCQHQKGTKA